MASSSSLFQHSAAAASAASAESPSASKPFAKSSAEYAELKARCDGNEIIADSLNGRDFFVPNYPRVSAPAELIRFCATNSRSVVTYSTSDFPFTVRMLKGDGEIQAKPQMKSGHIYWELKTQFLIGSDRVDYLHESGIKDSETIGQAIARVNRRKRRLLMNKLNELRPKLYAIEMDIGQLQLHIENQVGAAEIHEQGIKFFTKLHTTYRASQDLYVSQLKQEHFPELLSPRDAIAIAIDDANQERSSIYYLPIAERINFRKNVQELLLSSHSDDEVLSIIAERLKTPELMEYVDHIIKQFTPFAKFNTATAKFWLQLIELSHSYSFTLGGPSVS